MFSPFCEFCFCLFLFQTFLLILFFSSCIYRFQRVFIRKPDICYRFPHLRKKSEVSLKSCAYLLQSFSCSESRISSVFDLFHAYKASFPCILLLNKKYCLFLLTYLFVSHPFLSLFCLFALKFFCPVVPVNLFPAEFEMHDKFYFFTSELLFHQFFLSPDIPDPRMLRISPIASQLIIQFFVFRFQYHR